MSGQIWTWFDGEWREGNVPIVGAADHGEWLGSLVFDGARGEERGEPRMAGGARLLGRSTPARLRVE